MLKIIALFFICLAARGIEYLVFRTDQTFIGEAFLHKLFGILVLVFAVNKAYTWRETGFNKTKSLKHIIWGLLLGFGVFFVAYIVEFLILQSRDQNPVISFYVTSFSISGNQGMSSGFLFLLICIIGNIINVIMEEGVFRGLFIRIGEETYSFWKAALFSALLFGIWHIAQSVRLYIDGDISAVEALSSAAVYVVITTIMGIKYAMLLKITGSVWLGMAEHFVNNTIISVLHVTSLEGIDTQMSLRVAFAQLLSLCFAVILFIITKANSKKTFR